MLDYDINTQEGRKIFITNYPTGYYMGADEQRNEFVIYLTQGVEMVKTITDNMGNETVVRYNIEGKEIIEK